METKIYNTEGKEVDSLKLPESIFGLPWNADLVHTVYTSLTSSARENIAHTKTRGEVAGGGKKPWKQKGTGRARHGSIRSPLWVGGGVAHGPRNDKNFFRKVNKKEKIKALFTVLSAKLKEKEIFLIDEIKIKDPKTKLAVGALHDLSKIKGLESLNKKSKNSAIIALGAKDQKIDLAFRNIGNISIEEMRNINLISLLQNKYLIIVNPKVALKAFTK